VKPRFNFLQRERKKRGGRKRTPISTRNEHLGSERKKGMDIFQGERKKKRRREELNITIFFIVLVYWGERRRKKETMPFPFSYSPPISLTKKRGREGGGILMGEEGGGE